MANDIFAQDYKTKVRKGRDGWEANSEAEIGQTADGARILKLSTSKTRGGIAAFASVCIRKDCATGFVSETHALFADFTRSGIAMAPGRRATEKAIRDVHATALLEMDALIDEATAFYAAKEQEAA